jgi:UDPglucose 6-dehydrogenase
MNIGVVGVGRLGICFALLLDRAGHRVRASDIRSNYVAQLARREIQTSEPLVADLLRVSNIEFTSDTRSVIQHSDIIYVMVATPSRADGAYDVSAVERVVADLAESDFDIQGRTLVIGCTTNPGDCQRIQEQLRPRGVNVLYNPEFIAQGSIIRDLQQADIVLIGGEDPEVIAQYQQLYDDIQTRLPCVHRMSLTAAEIVKIGINCFLTTKISYANMIGELLTRSGLESDIDPALAAIAADSRVGARYMRYGFGYGGPCLPRDNRAFANYARAVGLDFDLGATVDRFNHQHTEFLIRDLISKNKSDLPFWMPSITYKPNTDIIEESQQLAVCQGLLAQGKTVWVRHSDLIPSHTVQDLQRHHRDRVRFIKADDPMLDQTELYSVLL